MNFYLKVFLISFVGFLMLFAGILFAIDVIYSDPSSPSDVGVSDTTEATTEEGTEAYDDWLDEDEKTELWKIAEGSSRVNILAFGLNEQLADTIMLFSYDPETNHTDVLSVPRDTYHYIEGYEDPALKKINATYGMPEIGGVNGMKRVLSEFLGVPIHYYLKVDFEAVKAVVDTLGGYEVTVPFDMDYDDSFQSLHIHLKKGYQVLNGEDTVKYLRFRKNNSGSISEGDVQRIPRQQHFVNAMMTKAISGKLPAVINTIIGGKYVQTDMTIEKALKLAVQAAAMPPENIKFYMLEGEAKMMNHASYWIHDPYALEKTLYGFYGFNLDGEAESTETSTEATSGN